MNSAFQTSKEVEEQIEGLKRTLRIYFEGELQYSYRLQELSYPFEEDEDLKKILDIFDGAYTMKDILNFEQDVRVTAVNHEEKLAFYYDTDQKFTEARKKTLEHYPKDLDLGYPVDFWIEKCDEINASPIIALPSALMDTMVDFSMAKSGYNVIRIKHKEFDWTLDGAIDVLRRFIKNSKNKNFVW
ncbi:MAG: hypothetical protein Q4P28_00860 [Tissierellia bacterium]|nr:hypothetical protein [Tissierellia bacterium]